MNRPGIQVRPAQEVKAVQASRAAEGANSPVKVEGILPSTRTPRPKAVRAVPAKWAAVAVNRVSLANLANRVNPRAVIAHKTGTTP